MLGLAGAEGPGSYPSCGQAHCGEGQCLGTVHPFAHLRPPTLSTAGLLSLLSHFWGLLSFPLSFAYTCAAGWGGGTGIGSAGCHIHTLQALLSTRVSILDLGRK